MAWGSHSEKEMIIGKVIFEMSRKNDVHNNYETDYRSKRIPVRGQSSDWNNKLDNNVTILGNVPFCWEFLPLS